MRFCACGNIIPCSGHNGNYIKGELDDILSVSNETLICFDFIPFLNYYRHIRIGGKRPLSKQFQKNLKKGQKYERMFCERFGFELNNTEFVTNIDCIHKKTGIVAEIKLDKVPMRDRDVDGKKRTLTFELVADDRMGQFRPGSMVRALHNNENAYVVKYVFCI